MTPSLPATPAGSTSSRTGDPASGRASDPAPGPISPPGAATAGVEGETATPSPPDIPPLAFVVPESFHALPIAATREERTELAGRFVQELYANGNDELWTAAAPYYAALGEAMGGQGLDYAAMGLFAIDDRIEGDEGAEGVAHCSFTVTAIESDHPSVEVAANGIREILVRDENNDARWIELPCGPAVSCVTLREYVLGAELTTGGAAVRLRMGQIQVYVPFPTGPYTAVFTLDTAAIDYWGEFSEMTMAILRSVSFAGTEGPEGAGDVDDAADPPTAEEPAGRRHAAGSATR
ncbi:hypothetical protein ACFO3J_19355 [Streptomyces polygonati]|uniref:Uncharacterized protein n=1 Tax=Streptomyces polygonati TaxID=1617087 RepID=A0ABV8HNL8_9ACTN